MNREDIIRMAREAGLTNPLWIEDDYAIIERFAKLVVAAEREACAKIADDAMGHLTDDAWCAARMIKHGIKARSQQ